MKIEWAKTVPLLLLIVLCASSAGAQSVVAGEPQKMADSNAIRVIRDPHTATLWLLERDPVRPSGPGRMILLNLQESSRLESASIANGIVKMNRNIPSPVIRSGDQLVVEENSAVVEARLGAVALGSAVEGGEFRVRLAIGGKVVRAIAIGPGRAALVANAGKP